VAEAIRQKSQNRVQPWKQYELKKECKVKWLRQPLDKPEVFDFVAYLGILPIVNKTAGYPYKAHEWIGYFNTWDSKPRKPFAGLLEVPVSATNQLDNFVVDFDSYVGIYEVGPDEKGSVYFLARNPETRTNEICRSSRLSCDHA